VTVGELDEHHESAVALDERGDGAVMRFDEIYD
jgi:hypothetical protein